MRDPYDVLGVPKGATQDEIKAAYRKLAKKLHPDLNPGDKAVEKDFQEVSAAYSLLSDAEKRKRFDNGEIDASGQETPRASGFYRTYAQGGHTKYEDFGASFSEDGDIFADLFGFRRSGRAQRGSFRQRQGADVHYSVSIPFLEAAGGGRRRLSLTEGKTLEVNIPPGTEDKQTLRLKGQGMPGIGGGPAGDAYIEVQVQPHPFFTRKGKDIHLELPITLREAVLGATIQVPTVAGAISMKVPAGSNSGQTLRLKGKGIAAGGESGNQYVKLRVVLPDQPDEELRTFLEGWQPAREENPRRKAGME